MRVVIDPGHAGRNIDPGAVNKTTGLQEADISLSVSRLVEKYLLAVGYEVKLTRTDFEQVETDDLSYRTTLANDWGADIFISLHCNSATNQKAKGYEVWTSPGNTLGDKLVYMGKLLQSFQIVQAEQITLTVILIKKLDFMCSVIQRLRLVWLRWHSFQMMKKPLFWPILNGKINMLGQLHEG